MLGTFLFLSIYFLKLWEMWGIAVFLMREAILESLRNIWDRIRTPEIEPRSDPSSMPKHIFEKYMLHAIKCFELKNKCWKCIDKNNNVPNMSDPYTHRKWTQLDERCSKLVSIASRLNYNCFPHQKHDEIPDFQNFPKYHGKITVNRKFQLTTRYTLQDVPSYQHSRKQKQNY